MGKKYYCEYCDKSFADSPTNRKNHVRGVVHKNLKSEHYAAFRDHASIYAEEVNKRPCREFFTRGQCKFGMSCIYTHYTPEQLDEIMKQSQGQPNSKHIGKTTRPQSPNIDDWLKKWKTKCLKVTSSSSSSATSTSVEETVGITLPEYELPPALQGIPQLPPSLLPPPPDALMGIVLEDWG